jgi:beta-N-acetylhexosaminidase
MRTVASWGEPPLARRMAACLGRQLCSLGFTINFAPVLDVNTCPENPVIGDRAFGEDPASVALFGTEWILGLQQGGVLACGKHFPGHGDTSVDSHAGLPVVHRERQGLLAIELAPFRAAAAAGIATMMTAHVVYSALDADLPATLSRSICTDLRRVIGFEGLLLSDDLEMGAIEETFPIEDASVMAIAAGCDAILVCHSEEKQERAVDALARETDRSPAFRTRCEIATQRLRDACGKVSLPTLEGEAVAAAVDDPESRALAAEIARRRSC